MKTRILLTVGLLVSHVFVFSGGFKWGESRALSHFRQDFESAMGHASLGHYRAYRDITLGITAGNYENAGCRAEMLASAMLDSIKECSTRVGCKEAIEKKAREVAPEVLGEAPVLIQSRQSCP